MDAATPSRVDHDTRTYMAGLADRRLELARCSACKHWIHPPRACCPACWSDDIEHAAPSGKATLFTYLVQPLAPGEAPSIIGWAELEEQERLLVIGPVIDATEETVKVGASLELCWIERNGAPIPAFRKGDRT